MKLPIAPVSVKAALCSAVILLACVPVSVFGLVHTSFQTTPIISRTPPTRAGAFVSTLGAGATDVQSSSQAPGTNAVLGSSASPTSGAASASNTSSAHPSNYPGGTPLRPIVHNLVFTKSAVDLADNDGVVYIDIWAEDGSAFPSPRVTPSSNMILATVSGPNYIPPTGGLVTQKVWHLGLRQADIDSGGQGTVTATTITGYTGTFSLRWSPVPHFSVTWGDLVRTAISTDTITYTANLTLVPYNFSSVGQPKIAIRLMGYSANTCLNSKEKTIVYTGQNALSIDCVVQRQQPYVPGSGYPPPMVGQLALDVYVDVQKADDSYMPSTTNHGFISAESPYNQ